MEISVSVIVDAVTEHTVETKELGKREVEECRHIATRWTGR